MHLQENGFVALNIPTPDFSFKTIYFKLWINSQVNWNPQLGTGDVFLQIIVITFVFWCFKEWCNFRLIRYLQYIFGSKIPHTVNIMLSSTLQVSTFFYIKVQNLLNASWCISAFFILSSFNAVFTDWLLANQKQVSLSITLTCLLLLLKRKRNNMIERQIKRLINPCKSIYKAC